MEAFLAICLAILLGAQVVAGALAHLAANLAPIGEAGALCLFWAR